MSLRDQAIDAMYRADGERVGERVYVEKALDGLLQWFRDNRMTSVDVHGGMPLGVLEAETLVGLLAYGGEETQ